MSLAVPASLDDPALRQHSRRKQALAPGGEWFTLSAPAYEFYEGGMKISIERGTLLKAVSQAQSVVERRNTIPILANVLIEAEGDTVSFRATDLDIEVVDKCAAMVERAGATTVSAVTLHEIVRKLPDGAMVQLTDDGASGRLTVEAGRSNFSLATLPKEDFPVMASAEYDSNFAVPAPVLRRLFDKSKFAISTEETRYYLNGVYMHVADSENGRALRCVATDGHRLARIDAPLPPEAGDMPGVIVPRKTVGELRKLLDDDEMSIAVSVSEAKVRFATPDITLTFLVFRVCSKRSKRCKHRCERLVLHGPMGRHSF